MYKRFFLIPVFALLSAVQADAINAPLDTKVLQQIYTDPGDLPLLKAKVGDDTLALVEVGLHNFLAGRYISEHDAVIGRHLGHILSGGAHKSGPSPRTVTEQQMLDLEREAFLKLCGERKSLERIQHMLQKGKPLRN